ncbi:MAG: hypothetical protein MR436_03415 [Eubacterium sp.]|nr:hypothetical protein [Eubacterium sp.]
MVKETRFGGQGKIKNKVMCYINIASEIPVQATGFDGRGTIYVHSRKLDETVSSTEVDLRSGSLNKTKSGAYNKYAAYNAYYYLKARIHNKKEIFILE